LDVLLLSRFAFRREMASGDRFLLRFFWPVLDPKDILAMPMIVRQEKMQVMDAPTRRDAMYPRGGSLGFSRRNIFTASK